MYAPPITSRLESMFSRKDDIFKLFDRAWDDQGIALYLGSDTRTIKRFRMAYRTFGTGVTRDQLLKVNGK